jgi:hypothetical protein
MPRRLAVSNEPGKPARNPPVQPLALYGQHGRWLACIIWSHVVIRVRMVPFSQSERNES